MTKRTVIGLCTCLILLFAFRGVDAQFMTAPQSSPKASVMQRIGITDVTITYHRPGVKGRVIWGELVPFNGGDPEPWRAGANENTVISFTHDVKINGNPLQAGSYGFHAIPSATNWILIFSKNYTSFGSYFYNPEDDALRITVTPEEAPFQERLLYGFDGLTDNSANAFLHWEKLKVDFTVKVDVPAITIASLKNQLAGGFGFFWWGYNDAANYCLSAETHYDQGLEWSEQSIKMEKNYRNLATKGQLLGKKGDTTEAKKILKEAKDMAPDRVKERIQRLIDNL
ncbi:MAG: DUF2911 domain-containing protein [bacterium]